MMHCLFDRGLHLVESMRLDRPAIGLGTVTGEELTSRRIAPEEPLEPVQSSPAKLAAVVVKQRSSVSDRQVTLPRRRIGRQVLEVALALDFATNH